MGTTTNTYPVTLERLINLLEEQSATKQLTPKKVAEIVAEANVDVEDMMHYADFDHPNEDCYGRKMVFDAGHFEVMVMSWRPRDYSSIHDHGHTEWGVVQVFGPVHHFIFNERNGELNISARQILEPREIIKVNNPLIHQMGNATSKRYVTLHVYGSNTRNGDITADAKSYDLEHDRISHTQGGAFFDLPDADIYDIKPSPKPTQETFLHHAHLLMDYYNRQEQTAEIKQKKMHLLKKLEVTMV